MSNPGNGHGMGVQSLESHELEADPTTPRITIATSERSPMGDRLKSSGERIEPFRRYTSALPHSARSDRSGREHGIWGRQEARSPEGASTARWGQPRLGLKADDRRFLSAVTGGKPARGSEPKRYC